MNALMDGAEVALLKRSIRPAVVAGGVCVSGLEGKSLPIGETYPCGLDFRVVHLSQLITESFLLNWCKFICYQIVLGDVLPL
jgi:hypothetical protein